jgi:TonB family protein
MKQFALPICMLAIPLLLLHAQNAAPPTESDPPDVHTFIEREPTLISKPPLRYPKVAEDAGIAGKIYVKGVVNREGVPVKCEILKREPEIAYLFDDVARQFFMKCRFSPAIDSAGKPVAVWVTIPLVFKMQDFTPPVPREVPSPEYPEEALEQGLEGWVGLAVLVEPSGRVRADKTVIVARYPHEVSIFDDAAKAAANNSTFVPAMGKEGHTYGWYFLKVPFEIKMH